MKLQPVTLQSFKLIHIWVGLLAGLLLFIAFFAGTITLFRDAITHWQYQQNQLLTDESLALVPDFVDAIVAHDPVAQRGIRIALPGGHEPGLMAEWRKPDGEVGSAALNKDGSLHFDDEVISPLSKVVDHLHRSAGIPGHEGEWIMGTAALLYGVALVSGVMLFLPTLLRDLFSWRPDSPVRRLWLNAHAAIGTLSLPFHIVFALTGAVMCLHDPMFEIMNKVIYPDNGRQLMMQAVLPHQLAPDDSPATSRPTLEIVKAVQAEHPGFEPYGVMVTNPGRADAVVSIMGDMPGILAHRVRVVVAGVSGDIMGVQMPGERPAGMAALSGFFALHYGDYGADLMPSDGRSSGLLLMSTYCLLGLLGCVLFFSGNLLWLEARRNKRAALQARSHRLLASLTVGICAGCCLAIASLFALTRLEVLNNQQPLIDLLGGYWLVLALACGWAMWRPAALACRDLLAASGVMCTFTVCLSLLYAAGIIGQAVELTAVDAALLVSAIGFLLLARKVQQRAQHGVANSVWSAQPG
ncbi:PepSY-associated TM helix domain-containing protein [Oceanobacter kriegii]|uniref:PepSY-associated TM helix domain-containing protein n=1 Tax=Oceanobacter kriegii TaxID=64972 RepID=UPI00040CF9E1|nr:PepSY-associated TM helix domain-containing protein [Oceanobacter kriegii]